MQLSARLILVVVVLASFLVVGCNSEAKSSTGEAAKGDQSSSSNEASTAAQPNRGAVERPGKEGK